MKTTQRLTSLALAISLTLATLGGIDHLAQYEQNELAAATSSATLAQSSAVAGAARV